jgi:hypothetical protein
MHSVDDKLEKMCTAIRSIDAEFPEISIPEVHICEITPADDKSEGCPAQDFCSNAPGNKQDENVQIVHLETNGSANKSTRACDEKL